MLNPLVWVKRIVLFFTFFPLFTLVVFSYFRVIVQQFLGQYKEPMGDNP